MSSGRIPSVEGGIQPTIVDAKGDLIVATAADTVSRLAVGSNGDTLVADSSATTGLRWQGNFAAGKNKIINGDFTINQRAFSSTTSALVYMFDRFFSNYASGTSTYSAQTFTPGAAPVAGYEARNFLRCVTTGQTGAGGYAQIVHRIEDVRTLAGQTATISFWAKAGSGTPKIGIELCQEFGSGGSPSADVTNIGSQSVTISTSWARYSLTVSVPSISGKTIGTTANTSSLRLNLWLSSGTDFATRAGTPGLQNETFDVWGVQVEAGNTATAFQTATGTLAGELAACQRYYQRIGGNAAYERIGLGAGQSSTVQAPIVHKVTMRVAPTSIDYSTLGVFDGINATISASAVTLDTAGKDLSVVNLTVSSPTAYRPYQVLTNNSTSGYLGFSAEL